MQKRLRVLIAIVVVVLLGTGAWLWATSGQESTDDAQVDAHVTPIAARVGGTVLEVPVADLRHAWDHGLARALGWDHP